MIDIGFAMDVVLAVLLVAVIGYAVVLNRKLSVLRDAKEEFEELLASFGATTEQAQTSLEALRGEATSVKESFDSELQQMQSSLDQVRSLSDDLEYLIKRGEKVADRMAGKGGTSPGDGPGAAGAGSDETEGVGMGKAQKKFLRTLQGVR